MRKLCGLLTMVGLVSTHAFAYTCIGSCQLGKEKVEYINSAGNTQLNGTTVTGNVHVAGKLIAEAARMNGLYSAGKTDLTHTIIKENTNIAGKATFQSSTFNGEVMIAAKAEVTDAKFNNQLKIAGKAELINSRMMGQTKIAGVLVAKHSVFEETVSIAAEKAIFSDSKLDKTLIIESKDKTPIVELICGTLVKGDIIFKGKSGIVKTEQPSKINFKVKNGKVESVNNPTCAK